LNRLYLIDERAFLAERDLIKRVIVSWKNQIATVRTSYNAMCDTCKSIGISADTQQIDCDLATVELRAAPDRQEKAPAAR